MNPISIGIFEALLGFQEASGITGNCIEFGVYRGRSAAVALRHLQPGERMMLIDVAEKYPEFDKLRAINPAFDFIAGKSESLVNDARLLDFVGPGVRFSHHDASHSYVNVAEEMKLMERYIQPRGLMVLDDFASPHYMQVVAAAFAHLSQPECGLEILLYSNNKAYLCRKGDFALYANFLLGPLVPMLHAVGLNVQLTRTNNSPEYRGFSIVPKVRPDDPDKYGLQIFGDKYYKSPIE